MKEPSTNTFAICKKKYHDKFNNNSHLLHYQEFTNQFDFESQLTIVRVTKRRSDIFKISQSWMCPWSELCCFHFVPKEPLFCTKFSFFQLQWCVIFCTKSVLLRYDVRIIASDKLKKLKRNREVFDIWIQRH